MSSSLMCIIGLAIVVSPTFCSGSEVEPEGHGGSRAALGSFAAQLSQLRGRHSVLTEEVAAATEEVLQAFVTS